jgi:hypothetical protein
MHLLTDRALVYEKYVDAEEPFPRRLHVEVTPGGELRIIGIPERGFACRFTRKMQERPVPACSN